MLGRPGFMFAQAGQNMPLPPTTPLIDSQPTQWPSHTSSFLKANKVKFKYFILCMFRV